MPPEMDADLASTMTPEELEAINGEDSPDEKLIMRQAPEGDDSDDDGDDNVAPVEGKPEATPEATEPATDEPDEAPQALAPRYEARLPSDYDAQIKGLKDRDAELRQKYKDGEIDIDERDEGLSALSEQREQLLVARAKAEISHEMTTQTAQSQWQTEINKAISRAAKEDGVDYRKDAAKANDWDQFVRILAAKPEHSDKSMDWFLAEAHRRVMALHGVAKAPAAPANPIADAKAKRKPPVAAMPMTLAQVPGSDGPGDVGSEFADIDALDGWELEQAIARMNPAQRAKYLKG